MELKEVQTREKIMSERDDRINKVLRLYRVTLKNIDSLRDFLENKPELIQVLTEARSEIKQIFGEVTVKLTADTDPEEGWSQLVGIIEVKLPVEKALALEEQFYREWFVDIFARTQDITIGVEAVA